MDPGNLDKELLSEMLSAMGRELKLARSRVKEAENEAKTEKDRAAAAEYALEVMTRNFEAMSEENHRLRESLDELRDSKVGVKQEHTEPSCDMPPERRLEHTDKSVSTDAGADEQAQNFEQAYQTYYAKYKSQKEAKNQIRDAFKELEINMSDLEKRYEGAKQKLRKLEEKKVGVRADKEAVPSQTTAPLDLSVIMHTRQDVYKFMSVLPKPIDRLRQPKLDPIGLRSMDLKSYIAADPQLKEVATNLLCLPGRISWCSSDNVHGIALGPMHLFNGTEYTTWTEGSDFIPLYGRTFHLFYTTHDLVYYAGLYKAIDLRTQCPEGISAEHLDHIFWPALAEALTSGSHLTKSLKNTLSNLYCTGALRVEPLGLQCIKFDLDIYTILKNRFSIFQSAMQSVGKREANFPEASMPSSLPKPKRMKTH